jgi:hypothetical protein
VRRVYSRSASKWIEVVDVDDTNVVELTARKRRANSKDAWVKVPIQEGIQMAVKMKRPEWAMLCIIREQIFLRKQSQVRVSNEVCRAYGVSRFMKARGLRTLAAAGVILVERTGMQAPLVTWIWPL